MTPWLLLSPLKSLLNIKARGIPLKGKSDEEIPPGDFLVLRVKAKIPCTDLEDTILILLTLTHSAKPSDPAIPGTKQDKLLPQGLCTGYSQV